MSASAKVLNNNPLNKSPFKSDVALIPHLPSADNKFHTSESEEDMSGDLEPIKGSLFRSTTP